MIIRVCSGVALLAILLILGNWGWRYYTASVEGEIEAEERIQSGDFRVHSYEHFFDLCQEIQSAQANLDAQKDTLDLLEQGSSEHTRAVRNINVLRSQIERLVNTYNSDARKEETVGQFRDSSLPERIEGTNQYERRISCQ